MKFVLWIILLIYSGFIDSLNAGTVERIYIHDNIPALKGSNIQLVCDVSQFGAQVSIFKTDSRLPDSVSGIQTLTFCIPSLCFTTTNGRYTFSADSSKIYINITNVNRSEDQKWWACAVSNQRKDIQLMVLTVPQTLQYENPPSEDQDLAQNAVTMKCSTGCSYPQPQFTWYYIESGGSQQVWSSSASVSNKAGGCTDYERIFTSTLSLARYTTFTGNVEKTIKFVCGIPSFPGMSQPLYTSSSVDIHFADKTVRVTSVTLKDGTNLPPESLQVESGVPKTLTCTTSVSRPAAIIVWYIGTVEKQRSSSSSSFTFNPQNNDHDKQIYCKAFNIQPESQALSSNKATLYVKVHVTSVTLKHDNTPLSSKLEVTRGVSLTLTCTTSASRPTATIIWFIGSEEKKRSTDSTSSLIFTPDNSDHGKQVYCKAFNLQTENQAVTSNKPSLFVKGSPRPLWQIPGNITSPMYVPVTLMFTTIAYPEPGPNGFSWYKENGNRWVPLLSNEDFHVSSCGLQTSLTILNVSRAHFGQYRVIVENGVGTYDQYIFLSEGLPVEDTASCKCNKESTALLIVAVLVGIICVVLVAYAVGITILYKRKIIGKDKKYPDKSTAHDQTTYVNTVYKPNDTKEQETTQRREITHNASGTNEDSLQQYTDLTTYSRDDKTTYDIIQTE